ncbi:16262_t:CDS:2 [Entrophospora sp. SA101]|nr:16262_t:CDS:2 [Entrophospora sp. SA101]
MLNPINNKRLCPNEIESTDPLAPSIIDTISLHSWFKSQFTMEEWELMKNTVNTNYHANDFEIIISKNNLDEIKNHLKNKEYEELNISINEGTWQLDSISIPLKIAAREIEGLKLAVNVYHSRTEIPDKPAPDWIRFVCVSDTHNMVNSRNFTVPEGDVLLHSGDLTKVGTVDQLEQAVNWLKDLPHRHKIVIAGNHDLILHKEFYETNWSEFHTVKDNHDKAIGIISKVGNGFVYLQESSYVIPEIGYKVYGSPWTPWFYDWGFNGERGEFLKEIWSRIPETTDILMTHGPPSNILDLVDGTENVGCEDLYQRVEEVKPLVHLFGHIHESYGILKNFKSFSHSWLSEKRAFPERFEASHSLPILEKFW